MEFYNIKSKLINVKKKKKTLLDILDNKHSFKQLNIESLRVVVLQKKKKKCLKGTYERCDYTPNNGKTATIRIYSIWKKQNERTSKDTWKDEDLHRQTISYKRLKSQRNHKGGKTQESKKTDFNYC